MAKLSQNTDSKDHQPGWVGFGAVFAFWTLIAIIHISQNVYSAVTRGDEIDWTIILSWSVIRWYLWAAFTLPVYRVAQRFPIERLSLKYGILKHTGLGFAAAALHMLLEAVLIYSVRLAFDGEGSLLANLRALLAYNFHVNLFVYCGLVGASHAFDYYKKLREGELRTVQLQADLSRSQLQVLKAQLQPHFLFNAHHTILGLMLKGERDHAIDMLTKLSDLLRRTLENGEVEKCSLGDELDFTRQYLEIQKTRFQDRLRVDLQIDPQSLDASVPNMLLQPLVENAVSHGLTPHSKAGRLRIHTLKHDGKLRVAVADDGHGIPPEVEHLFAAGHGLGITRARLLHLYGGRFELSLRNSDLGGAEVLIEIPFEKFNAGES
jgi:signal transduction histidine kinase